MRTISLLSMAFLAAGGCKPASQDARQQNVATPSWATGWVLGVGAHGEDPTKWFGCKNLTACRSFNGTPTSAGIYHDASRTAGVTFRDMGERSVDNSHTFRVIVATVSFSSTDQACYEFQIRNNSQTPEGIAAEDFLLAAESVVQLPHCGAGPAEGPGIAYRPLCAKYVPNNTGACKSDPISQEPRLPTWWEPPAPAAAAKPCYWFKAKQGIIDGRNEVYLYPDPTATKGRAVGAQIPSKTGRVTLFANAGEHPSTSQRMHVYVENTASIEHREKGWINKSDVVVAPEKCQ